MGSGRPDRLHARFSWFAKQRRVSDGGLRCDREIVFVVDARSSAVRVLGRIGSAVPQVTSGRNGRREGAA